MILPRLCCPAEYGPRSVPFAASASQSVTSLSDLCYATYQALTSPSSLECLPSCKTDIAVSAVQELQGETTRREAAEVYMAVITGQRDSSRAECAELRQQLKAMQQELKTAQAMMNEDQGCGDPAGQLPGQGCEGQPSGVGDVPLGSGAVEQEAGNPATPLKFVFNGVGFVPNQIRWCCCKCVLTSETMGEITNVMAVANDVQFHCMAALFFGNVPAWCSHCRAMYLPDIDDFTAY